MGLDPPCVHLRMYDCVLRAGRVRLRWRRILASTHRPCVSFACRCWPWPLVLLMSRVPVSVKRQASTAGVWWFSSAASSHPGCQAAMILFRPCMDST